MSKKLTKKTKRAICIYAALLIALYIVVEVLPKVTDIFETTQILEPGTLTVSHETTGYIIKEESIGIAGKTGKIKRLEEENTAVKKGHKIIKIKKSSGTGENENRFSEYTDRLKDYDGLSTSSAAPISGILSFTIDGYENYLTKANMNKVKKETVEDLDYDSADLDRTNAVKGEPVYKITNDDNWYILCWVDKETAENYSGGMAVSIELSEGKIDASVHSVKKDGEFYRVLFYVDVYYEALASSRQDDINIITSDNTGLIVDNKCIVEKNGEKGVYVKNKNDEYEFKRIQIIASDEDESVVDDATFIDEEGNQVYTVDVYDEVLRHPDSALEKDLENDSDADDESSEEQSDK